MTSYLLISSEAQFTHSIGFGYKMCGVIPVASHLTHGTTFRALKK